MAAAVAACVDLGGDEFVPTIWEAQLAAAPAYPGLMGQAAAISNVAGTSVSIGIDGAEPAAAHVWGVHLGTCVTPGQQIGPDTDYPALVVNDSGSASAEIHVGSRLVPTGLYHVSVRHSAADTSRVACGNLGPA